jgi:hypothetical protein
LPSIDAWRSFLNGCSPLACPTRYHPETVAHLNTDTQATDYGDAMRRVLAAARQMRDGDGTLTTVVEALREAAAAAVVLAGSRGDRDGVLAAAREVVECDALLGELRVTRKRRLAVLPGGEVA